MASLNSRSGSTLVVKMLLFHTQKYFGFPHFFFATLMCSQLLQVVFSFMAPFYFQRFLNRSSNCSIYLISWYCVMLYLCASVLTFTCWLLMTTTCTKFLWCQHKLFLCQISLFITRISSTTEDYVLSSCLFTGGYLLVLSLILSQVLSG